MKIIIRQANTNDIAFLIKSIFEAEKSGSSKLSYSTLFSLSEELVYKLIYQILEEDIREQELSISNFLVAEINGELIGAVSGWIEAENGISSSIQKANILSFFFPPESIIKLQEKTRLLNNIFISRTKGTLQVECIYVANDHRGKGIAHKLIQQHINNAKKNTSKLNLVEVILAGNNLNAQKAYEKTGFTIKETKVCRDLKILEYLPSNIKIQMQLHL